MENDLFLMVKMVKKTVCTDHNCILNGGESEIAFNGEKIVRKEYWIFRDEC